MKLSTTSADKSCSKVIFSDLRNVAISGGREYLVGISVLPLKPSTVIAAAITRDFKTTIKTSLSALYADFTSLDTFLLLMAVRSANKVHWSTAEEPLKNLEKINYKNVQLKEGSLVYKQWHKQTSPVYMQYFVFHLNNSEEVVRGGVPSVIQKGPYSYKEIRSTDILNYTADKTVVTFMPNRTYIFDPETSCDGCNDTTDTFTTVNIPLLSVALWLRNTNYPTKQKGCYDSLKVALGLFVKADQKKFFQSKTVYDMLWGYVDPVVKLIKDTAPTFNCPIKAGMDPFIQLQYNNTYYGISAINTGIKDINKLEQYTMWRNEKSLSWWESKYANMLNGTDGTQFKPRISKTDKLYTFVPEICRSIYAVYESSITVRDIKLFRFTAPKEIYLTGDIYPPNMGFCVPPAGCLPTGLLNVTRCQPQNPPVAVSPPHFYQSNESLVEAVKGMHPVKSEHGTFIDVEPITGITMQANKRIQINVRVEPVDTLDETKGNFSTVFLPVMYVNESAKVSEEDAKKFRQMVYDPIDLTKGIEYGLLGLGGLLVIIAIILFALERNKTDKFGHKRLEYVG